MQPVETSLVDEPVPDVTDDQATTDELIQGGWHKGKGLVVDSVGFTYAWKRTNKAAVTTWTCRARARKCTACVVQHGDSFIRNATEHNHLCDPGAAMRTKARAMVSDIIYTQFDLILTICIYEVLEEVGLKSVFIHKT